MSNPGGSPDHPERAALRRLEGAVARAAERLEELHARATAAEARGAELEHLLRRFTGDDAEAARALSRLRALEAENAELRARLALGRAGVDRMLARLRFLEEQR